MGTRNRNKFSEYQLRFVTTTSYKWLKLFVSDESMRILSNSLNFLNLKYRVNILAYVLMPNNVHLILSLNSGDDLSAYMRDFKKFTSVQIRKYHERKNNLLIVESLRFEKGKQKLKVWQDRFDDFSLTNYSTFLIKLNYIHINPVKKGIVQNASDYIYSSAGFYEIEREGLIKVQHCVEVLGPPNVNDHI